MKGQPLEYSQAKKHHFINFEWCFLVSTEGKEHNVKFQKIIQLGIKSEFHIKDGPEMGCPFWMPKINEMR